MIAADRWLVKNCKLCQARCADRVDQMQWIRCSEWNTHSGWSGTVRRTRDERRRQNFSADQTSSTEHVNSLPQTWIKLLDYYLPSKKKMEIKKDPNSVRTNVLGFFAIIIEVLAVSVKNALFAKLRFCPNVSDQTAIRARRVFVTWSFWIERERVFWKKLFQNWFKYKLPIRPCSDAYLVCVFRCLSFRYLQYWRFPIGNFAKLKRAVQTNLGKESRQLESSSLKISATSVLPSDQQASRRNRSDFFSSQTS